MNVFEYRRPASLAETLDLLARPGSVVLAGGTDLLVALRHHAVEPATVVDIKTAADLDDGIAVDDGHLVVGARCVLRRLIEHEEVNAHFPALVHAASVVGSVQIRNRATLSGNLCNASPAADTAPALIAYDAKVVIDGSGGRRRVPVADFFVGPGATVLGEGEIVTAILLPIPAGTVGASFARVTRRRGVDLASVNLACVVDQSGAVRYGFGAVGPTPLFAESTVDDLTDAEAWEGLLAVTSPISDVRAGAEYRKAMLEVHARRALEAATRSLREAS